VCANLARHADIDLGAALRGANHKFERRFRSMEAQAEAQGDSLAALDLDAQEALWQHAKATEKA
jgi:ATP diphosphatase